MMKTTTTYLMSCLLVLALSSLDFACATSIPVTAPPIGASQNNGNGGGVSTKETVIIAVCVGAVVAGVALVAFAILRRNGARNNPQKSKPQPAGKEIIVVSAETV